MSESTSSREDNVGAMVYSRSAGIGDQAEDWDDTSLVEAYDAALGGILDKLDKRQQHSSSEKASSSSQAASQSAQAKWKKNDFCKAQYSVDRQWYEARILAVDGAYCMVEYLGYMNCERQLLKALKPSGGRKQRQLQLKCAEQEEGGCSDGSREDDPSTVDNLPAGLEQTATTRGRTLDRKSTQSQQRRQEQQLEHLLNWHKEQRPARDDEPQKESATKQTQQTKDSSRKRGANESQMPPMIAFPPPPPPFPPGVDEICDSDEALAAMLISWYISGYHTGYYTAVRNSSNR